MATTNDTNPETISAPELHRILLRAFRLGNRARLRFLRALLAIHRTRLYLELGYSSTVQYAAQHFGYRRTHTYESLRVAGALESLHRTTLAFGEGQISWSALRELTRVAGSETEAAWLDFAVRNSYEALRAEVEDAAKNQRKLPRKNRYGLPRLKVRVAFELEPQDHVILDKALSKVAAEIGDSLGGEAVKPHEALLYLARRVLEDTVPGGSPGKVAGRGPSAYRILYRVCPACRSAHVATHAGFVEVPEHVVASVEGDAEKVEIPADAEVEPGTQADEVEPLTSQYRREPSCDVGRAEPSTAADGAQAVPTPDGTDALLNSHKVGSVLPSDRADTLLPVNKGKGDSAEVVSPPAEVSSAEAVNSTEMVNSSETTSSSDRRADRPARDRPNSPALVRSVCVRDGGVCANPRCGRTEGLHAHHIRLRSRGGRTALWNEVLLCARCHAAVHQNLLEIRGNPGEGLEWIPAAARIDLGLEEDRQELSAIPVVVAKAACDEFWTEE